MIQLPPLPDDSPVPEAPWQYLIPDHEWAFYLPVIERAQARGLSFVIGGGFAFSHYSRRWRNTKDLDLYFLPSDRDAMVQVVTESGFADYFDRKPYDRSWIYRSFRDADQDRDGVSGEVICDLIWSMPNHRADADRAWLERGPRLRIRGTAVRLIPPEELLWAKLYVFQRDRCDWPDLLNILYSQGPTLDWPYLLERVGNDAPLLTALLTIFAWMCPGRAAEVPPLTTPLPPFLNPLLPSATRPASPMPPLDPRHVELLDTRDWFGPTLPLDQGAPTHAHRSHESSPA